MLTPATQDLTAYTNGIFDPVLLLVNADQSAFDLTGYTVAMVIATPSPLTLTAGSGLTITPLTGQIAIKLTPTQTNAVPAPDSQGTNVHYYIKLTSNGDATNVVYPVHGTVSFKAP